MTDQFSGLLIKIDGSQAKPEAQALQSGLDKLTASGNAATGSFDKLTQAAKAGAGAQASHGREVKGAADALNIFSGATTRAKTELLVLLHELSQGNTRRFGGSMMVLAEQLGIAGKLMSPIALGVGVVAAAIGGLIFAAVRGSQDVSDFNKAIQLTGGMAGVTRGQYEGMVRTISTGNGQIAGARSILNDLVKSGQFTATALTPVARAIADVADASGKTADKVGPDLAKAFADGARGAQQLNSVFHFLTTSQFQYIQELERQGRNQEAAALTAQALADHLEAQKAPLGALGALWHGLGVSINEAWDSTKKFFSAPTMDDQVMAQMKRIQDLQSRRNESGGYEFGFDRSRFNAALLAEQQKFVQLIKQRNLMQQQAGRQSATDVRQQLGIDDAAKADADLQRLKEQVATYDKGQAAVARYNEQLALNKAAGIKDARQRELYIEQVKRTHAPIIEQAQALDRLNQAQKQATVALSPTIRAQAEAAITAATAQQKLQDQVAKLSFTKGATSYKDYYDSLVRIENDAYSKMAAARATELAALNAELQRLQGLGLKAPQGSIEALRGEATTIQGQIQNLAADHQQKLDDIDLQRVQAEQRHDELIDQLRSELYQRQSLTQQQYQEQAERKFKEWLRKIGNDADGQNLARKLFAQDQIDAQLRGLDTQRSNVLNTYQAQRDKRTQPVALFGVDKEAQTAISQLQKQQNQLNQILINNPGNQAALKAYRQYEDEKTRIAKEAAQQREALATNTLNFGADQLDALANLQNKHTKSGFEKWKAFEIASATLHMISGAIGAFSQTSAAFPAPYGEIAGGAAAALVLATGAENIAHIRATQFSAAGGWGEVPYDGAQTTLHKQEMVLPAWIAEPLRQGIRGGGAGSPAPIVNITNAPAGSNPSVNWDGRALTIDMAPDLIAQASAQAVATIGAQASNPLSRLNQTFAKVHGTTGRNGYTR